jgi:hypothetical protein
MHEVQGCKQEHLQARQIPVRMVPPPQPQPPGGDHAAAAGEEGVDEEEEGDSEEDGEEEKQAQFDSKLAEFLLCGGCGVAVTVDFLWEAVNDVTFVTSFTAYFFNPSVSAHSHVVDMASTAERKVQLSSVDIMGSSDYTEGGADVEPDRDQSTQRKRRQWELWVV